MQRRNLVKIKICGLSRMQDIEYVNEAKPDYCGFIINVPKSIRNTTPDKVRLLKKGLSSDIIPTGVFVNENPENIRALTSDGTIKAVQLHGDEDEAYIQRLRTYGNFTIIKAFRAPVSDESEKIRKWADNVMNCSADLVLLDQGSGGTGKTFNWKAAEYIKRPYFLAGGIGPDNIIEALNTLKPWGADMSSSLETGGFKDRNKILDVVLKIRSWEQERAAAYPAQKQGEIV